MPSVDWQQLYRVLMTLVIKLSSKDMLHKFGKQVTYVLTN